MVEQIFFFTYSLFKMLVSFVVVKISKIFLKLHELAQFVKIQLLKVLKIQLFKNVSQKFHPLQTPRSPLKISNLKLTQTNEANLQWFGLFFRQNDKQ